MVTGEKEEKGRDSQFGFRFIFVGIGDDCGNYDYEFDDGCTGCRESSNFFTQNGKREITDMTIGSREHSIMSQRSWQCHNQQDHGDHDDGHACCHVRCRRGLVMLVLDVAMLIAVFVVPGESGPFRRRPRRVLTTPRCSR
jgi:hypothetical protein